MNESKISVRYAKALLSLGKEENILPILRENIEKLNNSIISIPELQHLLENPIIKSSQKLSVLNNTFKDIFHPVMSSFLSLIIKNRREAYLSSMARVFIDLYKKDSNIKSATLTTSKAINVNLRNTVKTYIAKKLDINIELDEKVNEKLIGGFILRIEDQQIDASVLGHLNKIRQSLLTA